MNFQNGVLFQRVLEGALLAIALLALVVAAVELIPLAISEGAIPIYFLVWLVVTLIYAIMQGMVTVRYFKHRFLER